MVQIARSIFVSQLVQMLMGQNGVESNAAPFVQSVTELNSREVLYLVTNDVARIVLVESTLPIAFVDMR